MFIKPSVDIANAPSLAGGRDGISNPTISLAAALFISAWSLASVFIIQGFETWARSPEYILHLALNIACMALAAGYAARVQGPLDDKLSQALTAVLVIFGVLALIILGSRLFFSRPMLIASLVGGFLVSFIVVYLRHRLATQRVAVIMPLVGELPIPPTFGTLVHDPKTDLRGFDLVLISLSKEVSAEWSRALSQAMLSGCKVRHIGEHFEELKGSVSLEHFEIDHLPPNGIASYKAVKRAMDIGLVVFLLPVAIPVIVASSFLLLITMGRPVFYFQERIGLGGEPFTIWKLRTMRPEQAGTPLKAAVIGDLRVTRLGRVLRRFRIDELPQLWNVLKGDMSLIGPRPEALTLHEQYLAELPSYAYRYLVRPGITGWAQVSTTPSATTEEARRKLMFDLFYVKKVSLYLDLQIVVRTFWTIAAGGGAR